MNVMFLFNYFRLVRPALALRVTAFTSHIVRHVVFKTIKFVIEIVNEIAKTKNKNNNTQK